MKKYICLFLVLALCMTLGACGKDEEIEQLGEELAILEYRVSMLEGSAATNSVPGNAVPEQNTLSEDQQLVYGAVRNHGMCRMEIIGAMDYSLNFSGEILDLILVKVSVSETVKNTVDAAEYILIDRADGTVLDHSKFVNPTNIPDTPASHEEARMILYWAFSSRGPDVAWNDGIWADHEIRNEWSAEEVSALNAALAK